VEATNFLLTEAIPKSAEEMLVDFGEVIDSNDGIFNPFFLFLFIFVQILLALI
jgi:hypothetical protein